MILAFQLKSKKIEMILLLTAEYSLKTNTEEINMATTTMLSFNPFANIGEQIEYGALANSCGFGQEEGKSSFACILSSYISQQQEIERLTRRVEELEHKDEEEDEDEEHITEEQVVAEFIKNADKYGLSPAQKAHGLATTKAIFDGLDDTIDHQKLQDQLTESIVRIARENAELKGQVEHLKLAGYYCHTRPAPNAEINTDDAAFDHYWSVQDNDLTLWKVPRHLADVASAQTSYHGAVEQAFYDECFGEEYGKLKWMRVREMTQADLIKGGWQPKAEEEEQYATCEDCGRNCYTGGKKYPDGYTCEDCEPEENSDDDGADSDEE